MALLALLLFQQDPLRPLTDEDPDVRDAAMERLLEPALLERALANRDPEVRARARAVQRALSPALPEPARWGLNTSVQLGVGVTIASSSPSFGVFSRIEVPPRPDPEAPPAESDVRAWIAGLGAETVSEREAATASLLAAGRYAESALQEAAGGADLEAAVRARSLLARLSPRVVQVRLSSQSMITLDGTSSIRRSTFSPN